MTPNAKQAFDELVAMGVNVMPWGKDDGYCAATQFVIIWSNNDGTELYADIEGRRIREHFVGDQIVNCMNIREDVHEVLRQRKLSTEWENFGQLAVKDGPSATGYRHDKCGEWALRLKARRKGGNGTQSSSR